jgi:hypothetical protein
MLAAYELPLASPGALAGGVCGSTTAALALAGPSSTAAELDGVVGGSGRPRQPRLLLHQQQHFSIPEQGGGGGVLFKTYSRSGPKQNRRKGNLSWDLKYNSAEIILTVVS